MNNNSILEKLKNNKTLFSVEFYPPKNEAGARQIFKTANKLKEIEPSFASITYGAGGSSRELTIEYASFLQEVFGYEIMPHLTCVGHTKDEILEILEKYEENKFHNIMALRGDPPKGEKDFIATKGGFSYANELVSFIKEKKPNFTIAVAAYPEKHPSAKSLDIDIKHLKEKVDSGASFITTQMFFDNEKFLNFRDKCKKQDIEKPMIAGILPVSSLSQIERFCSFCETTIPQKLYEDLKKYENDTQKSAEIGTLWAFNQIKNLVKEGINGVHLYILNQSQTALTLAKMLKEENILKKI